MKTLQKTLQGAVVVAAFVASSGIAKADLTLNGAVGLPLNPTAQIPAKDAVQVQANYFDLGQSGFKNQVYGIYGAGQVADGVEISGGIERLDSDADPLTRTGVALGAKYLFTRNSEPSKVQFAAGVGYSRSVFNNIFVYGVASKAFNSSGDRAPIVGHLGVRYDRFDFNYLGGPKSNKTSVYGGVEIPFTSKGDFSFVGEIQSKVVEFSGAKEPYSAGLRYHGVDNGFSATVGIQRRPIAFTNSSRLFAQVGYAFGTHGEDDVDADDATTMPTP